MPTTLSAFITPSSFALSAGAIVRSATAVLVLGTLLAAPAFAADVVTDVAAAPEFETVPQRSVLLGAGVGVQPVYEGSDEYRVFPFPILSYDSGVDGPRRFEFRALDDIRLHALRAGGFSVGPIVGYSFGREEDEADILDGLGDVEGGIVVGGFAAYEFMATPTASYGIDVGISTQVSGDIFEDEPFEDDFDYGYEIDFGVSGEFDLTPRLNLAARAGAIYASDEYMETYFGINAAQAAAATDPSITAFDADGGIKNAYINFNAAFDATDTIQLRAGVGYSRLVGDAEDSPVTVEPNQFQGSLGAAYRFRF